MTTAEAHFWLDIERVWDTGLDGSFCPDPRCWGEWEHSAECRLAAKAEEARAMVLGYRYQPIGESIWPIGAQTEDRIACADGTEGDLEGGRMAMEQGE